MSFLGYSRNLCNLQMLMGGDARVTKREKIAGGNNTPLPADSSAVGVKEDGWMTRSESDSAHVMEVLALP